MQRRLLAERGANVETPKSNGATPVFVAAENDHAEVVRLLAELGANVKTPSNTKVLEVLERHPLAQLPRAQVEEESMGTSPQLPLVATALALLVGFVVLHKYVLEPRRAHKAASRVEEELDDLEVHTRQTFPSRVEFKPTR